MKNFKLMCFAILIGGGLLISSCNKDKQLTPETQTEFGNKKNLSSDIPWNNFNWASFHKEGIAGNYGDGDNPFLGLDITDYIKEKLHNDPEVVPQFGQFKEVRYYKMGFQEAYDFVDPKHIMYQRDINGNLPEFINQFHSASEWNSSILDIKTFIQEKLAELQATNPGVELRVKYINFEQGHCSIKEEFPWMEWAGNVMGLTGFYYGTWEERTIRPDLQLKSDINWDAKPIAAVHKMGNLTSSPDDYANNELALLDASDYIEELCMLDPALIPQHGRFHTLKFHRLSFLEWSDFVMNQLYFQETDIMEDPEAFNVYRPASDWAAYHPIVKNYVLGKLYNLQEENGNSKLRVKAISFDQGHFYNGSDNQENPFVTDVEGHFHSLYGFYYGEWTEE